MARTPKSKAVNRGRGAVTPRPWCRMITDASGADERLPDDFAPFIRKETVQTRKKNAITMLQSPSNDYAIDDDGTLAAILDRCDGKRTIVDLAKAVKVDVDQVRDALQGLYMHGLLAENCSAVIPGVTYFEHLCATAHIWSSDDQLVPERVLESGQLTARHVIGDLVRVWLGTRAQGAHIAIAAARAVSDRSQHAWSRLFTEEYEHQYWLSEGLEKYLTADELRRARPLPMQVAVLNSARCAALQDELAYAAVNILNETSEEVRTHGGENVTYYREVMARKLVPNEVIEPEVRHVTFDAQRRHLELIRVAFEENGPVSLPRRRVVLGHLWDMSQLARAMEQEEFEFYANPKNPRVYMGPPELELPWINPTSDEEVRVIREESVWLPATEGVKFPYTRPTR